MFLYLCVDKSGRVRVMSCLAVILTFVILCKGIKFSSLREIAHEHLPPREFAVLGSGING